MKGHLFKNDQPESWYVSYSDLNSFKTELPLHPYDILKIRDWEKIFDNVDARLYGKEVDFEIEDFWETGLEEVFKVAKLK